MRTYITDIIPKIQRFSQKLDNLTLLMNQHWVAIDDIENTKSVYIFRENNELLIALNGRVERAKWEYLGFNSLLVERGKDSFLFKHGFFDENILALKLDSKNEYVLLVNETKFNLEINSIDSINQFLEEKYLNSGNRDIISKEKEYDPKVILPVDLEYKIIRKSEAWAFSTGKYIKHEIIFENSKSLKGEFFFAKKTGKYFHITTTKTFYFGNIGECIYSLYKYLTQKNKN